jgi:hypothetical protein
MSRDVSQRVGPHIPGEAVEHRLHVTHDHRVWQPERPRQLIHPVDPDFRQENVGIQREIVIVPPGGAAHLSRPVI